MWHGRPPQSPDLRQQVSSSSTTTSRPACTLDSHPEPGDGDPEPRARGLRIRHDLAAEFTGLCDAGIEVLADAAGISVLTPINAHAVMAGGALSRDKDARGISHLDFDAIDAAFPEAVAACS
jgi:hypothetical protein